MSAGTRSFFSRWTRSPTRRLDDGVGLSGADEVDDDEAWCECGVELDDESTRRLYRAELADRSRRYRV